MNDGTIDHRSDLYALGVILYELSKGQPPFTGDNINTLRLQHAYTPAPPLDDAVPGASRPLRAASSVEGAAETDH